MDCFAVGQLTFDGIIVISIFVIGGLISLGMYKQGAASRDKRIRDLERALESCMTRCEFNTIVESMREDIKGKADKELFDRMTEEMLKQFEKLGDRFDRQDEKIFEIATNARK